MVKKVTFWLFLLTVFSLPFANFPLMSFAGMKVQATELFLALTAIGFAILVITSPCVLRRGALFYFLVTAH